MKKKLCNNVSLTLPIIYTGIKIFSGPPVACSLHVWYNSLQADSKWYNCDQSCLVESKFCQSFVQAIYKLASALQHLHLYLVKLLHIRHAWYGPHCIVTIQNIHASGSSKITA